MARRNDIVIATLALTTANTEYEYELPSDVERFRFQLRDTSVKLRIATVTGKVAGSTNPFFTLPADASWEEDNLVRPITRKFYFATPSASQELEIMYWTGAGRES